jgi:nucleoside-diphosphate-sugar epimerase
VLYALGATSWEGRVSSGGLVVGLTGATGHIGGLVLATLVASPEVAEVRSVARRPLGPAAVGLGQRRLVHVCADVRDPGARRALEGVDVLYHLASQVWQGGGAHSLATMAEVNIDGTRNILRARPGAVVLVSSAAVYGAWPDNPLPLDEGLRPCPNHECPYAGQKLLAEAVCAQEAGTWVVVRLAAVLGPHADARVARAVQGYRLAVPAVRAVPQAVQWLDEADAVEGVLAAGRALVTPGRGVAGEVFNIATRDWLTAPDAARAAGSRVVTVPRRALMAGSGWGRRLGVTPFGVDRAVMINGPLALAVTKAARVLGWAPTKTSAQVLADALARGWRDLPLNRAS